MRMENMRAARAAAAFLPGVLPCALCVWTRGENTPVLFSSYPPGTACRIDYVCRMVTGSALCEWG